jgi:hypothetical protein
MAETMIKAEKGIRCGNDHVTGVTFFGHGHKEIH